MADPDDRTPVPAATPSTQRLLEPVSGPGEPEQVHPNTGDPGSLPAAVLIDLDGTLIDTEPLCIRIQRQILAELGGTWSDDDALRFAGRGFTATARAMQTHATSPIDLDVLVALLSTGIASTLRRHTPWKPGAAALLSALHAAAIPTALVTMNKRTVVEAFLAANTGRVFFDTVVTADDVTCGKPDPEPYRTAAARLNVDITACVAIEDSRTGLCSASTSGATVLTVPGTHDLIALPNHTPIPTLEHLTLDALRGRLPPGRQPS